MHNQKDSAHLLAAPPFFFIIPLLVGAIVEYFVPTSLLATVPSIIIGLLFSWASLPFIILSLKSFYKVKTTFDARKTTTTLVTTGIYKISRNPAYLSLVLFYIGLSFLINSVWILILVMAAIYSVQKFCIEREEKYLESKFGSQYLNYKKKVRRWL
ncbi:MAG: isoprenylcysteine carboxylmethyltransferase family protein [Ignavibacteriaceae bacterium]|nr:isoprenylcysteine carboxylmethyltransferase family protein [Ignavibacteriaceae bacterium]